MKLRAIHGLSACIICICRAAGSPSEGISLGPIKFSRTAELVNARGAMVLPFHKVLF